MAAYATISGAGSDMTVSVRPESIGLSAGSQRPDFNSFNGTVRDVFFLGDHMRLTVEAFGGQLVTARIPARRSRPFAPGEDVMLECGISECRLLEA